MRSHLIEEVGEALALHPPDGLVPAEQSVCGSSAGVTRSSHQAVPCVALLCTFMAHNISQHITQHLWSCHAATHNAQLLRPASTQATRTAPVAHCRASCLV
jgi:hypothetical protein